MNGRATQPTPQKSRALAIVFAVYLALIVLGWGCVLADEDTVIPWVIQGLCILLAISGALGVVIWIPWTLVLNRRQEKGLPLPARRTTVMCYAMVVLLPFLFYAGVGVLFTVPFWIVDWMKSEAAKTVKTAASPDGKWVAYVVGRPVLDGHTWQLYLKKAGEPKGWRVARLMGDVDWNDKIYWSPRGDVVLFKNHYSLFAIRPADLKSAAATVGARRAVRPNSTFSVDSRALAEVSEIKFSAGGGVDVEYTATLKGKSETKRLPAEAFQNRPEGYQVSPLEGEPGA
jgi:hypothetical protein